MSESPTEALSVPNSPIQQDKKVGRRDEAFFPSLLEVVCVIMQMRQAKCMQDLLCLAAGGRWIAGETKILHWAAQGDPCFERSMPACSC